MRLDTVGADRVNWSPIREFWQRLMLLAQRAGVHPLSTYRGGRAVGEDQRRVTRPGNDHQTVIFRRPEGPSPRLEKEQREAVMDAERVWRWLALSLMRSERLRRPWAVGITSAVHGEGKTTSALALAVALARETEQQVLLVETDMERPIISRLFNRRLARGLPHYLSGSYELKDVINHVQGTNLNLLTAGDSSISPNDLPLGELSIGLRRQFPRLIQTLRKEYLHILVDLPALLEDPNTQALTESLDGSLLVVKSGVTPMDKAKDAGMMLGEDQTLGVVHISAPSSVPRWLSNLITA